MKRFFFLRCDNHPSIIIINFTQGDAALNGTDRQTKKEAEQRGGWEIILDPQEHA